MDSPRFIEPLQRSRFRLAASAAFLLLGLVALAANEMQQRAIIRYENRLSVAGFVEHLADTPDLQSKLDLMPRHQVVRRARGEAIRYVFADPDVCSCFYVGSQQAYDLYRKLRLEQRLAHRQPIAAGI